MDDLDAALKLHAGLVRRIALHMVARLPASVELDDLIQAGMIGLADALKRFDPSRGAAFETYAETRIRGAMLDELRAADYLSRDGRERQKAESAAVQFLQQSLGREPRASEVASHLGMSVGDFHDSAPVALCSDDRAISDMCDDEAMEPLPRLQELRRLDALVSAFDRLPDRESYVMRMLYVADMPMADVAAALCVSKAYVCRLRDQAVGRLVVMMRGH